MDVLARIFYWNNRTINFYNRVNSNNDEKRMNIFKILNNIYTNKSSKWILELDDKAIQPYVIQRWLCMNKAIDRQTRWLDKYVFIVGPKKYLSLAWSCIPKSSKAPFVKYIKKEQKEEKYKFITDKIKDYYKMAHNDYRAIEKQLIPVVCLGESLEHRENGKTDEVITSQFEKCFLNFSEFEKIVIAYEPVWAIGTGKTATPEQAQEVHKLLRDLLKQKTPAFDSVQILYGGSVKPGNAADLVSREDIDGFLAGGASLKAEAMRSSAKTVSSRRRRSPSCMVAMQA